MAQAVRRVKAARFAKTGNCQERSSSTTYAVRCAPQMGCFQDRSIYYLENLDYFVSKCWESRKIQGWSTSLFKPEYNGS
eukprot:3233655-Amphidinium_carterae.2